MRKLALSSLAIGLLTLVCRASYFYSAAAPGGGGPVLVAHVAAGTSATGGTTGTIVTTGANHIVVNVAYFPGQTGLAVTDSNSNTYTPRQAKIVGDSGNRLFDCHDPIVGPGHTFTVSGTNVYASIQVAAFSGITTFDQENIDGGMGTAVGGWATLSTGSNLTPSQATTLVVTGLASGGTFSGATINDGFTVTDSTAYLAANYIGGSLAYKFLSAATPTSPTWANAEAASDGVTNIAIYKY